MKTQLLLFLSFLVISLNAQNGFTTYTTSPANFSGTGPKRHTAMLADNAGNLWFGFKNATPLSSNNQGGLVRYNLTTQFNTVYTTKSIAAAKLTAGKILSNRRFANG